jgi:predicted transcriptional regulator
MKILTILKDIKCNKYYKLSGRYYLNENFNINIFNNNEKIVMRKSIDPNFTKSLTTVYYSIPCKLINILLIYMQKILPQLIKNNLDIETLYYYYMYPQYIEKINNINVNGYLSSNKIILYKW